MRSPSARRALRPAFIVTLSTFGPACASTPEPDLTPVGPVEPGMTLNGRTTEGDTIYRSGNGCVIHVPFKGRQGSWQPPDIEEVACPPHMKDEAWNACGGWLTATADPTECECRVDGNPPPPDRKVACPKR